MIARRIALGLKAAFVSRTAAIAWLASLAGFWTAVALFGLVDGMLIGTALSKLTYAPCLISGIAAAFRKVP